MAGHGRELGGWADPRSHEVRVCASEEVHGDRREPGRGSLGVSANGHGGQEQPPGCCLGGVLLVPLGPADAPTGPGNPPGSTSSAREGALAVVCPAPLGAGLRFWLAPLETEKRRGWRKEADWWEGVECLCQGASATAVCACGAGGSSGGASTLEKLMSRMCRCKCRTHSSWMDSGPWNCASQNLHLRV